jgi:hypothetical protein
MTLFSADLFNTGFATGVVTYQDAYPGQESAARIVIPLVIAAQLRIRAIVDTGAPWCVLDPGIAESIIEPEQNPFIPQVRLLIRKRSMVSGTATPNYLPAHR